MMIGILKGLKVQKLLLTLAAAVLGVQFACGMSDEGFKKRFDVMLKQLEDSLEKCEKKLNNPPIAVVSDAVALRALPEDIKLAKQKECLELLEILGRRKRCAIENLSFSQFNKLSVNEYRKLSECLALAEIIADEEIKILPIQVPEVVLKVVLK